MMDLNGSLTYRFLASIFGDFLYGSLQCHLSSKFYQGRSRNHCEVFFRELKYADDNDTVTQKPQNLQRTADQFNAAYKHFGMDVNTEKTKLLVQHASNRPQPIIPTVQVNTRTVESVPSFPYLGSLLSPRAKTRYKIA